MATKKGVDHLGNLLESLMIDFEDHKEVKDEKIVDIMTFCNDPKYLDLPGDNNRLNLFLSQKVILKCFYMKTEGNEELYLDKEEWEWLYNLEEPEEIDDVLYENNIKDVLRKMIKRKTDPNMKPFSHLQLVLGRRASKTLLSSIITVYEAYKLLVVNNGDPHGQYGLPDDDEIAIINVALSQKQSGRMFQQIGTRIRNSPFFKGRVAKSTNSEIRLYTKSDIRKKAEGMDITGSILLLSGHSNPDSLAGYNAIMILFDEIAFFDESGKVTGSYFVERLSPSLSKFFKYNVGKIVLISSPNNRNGIFYDTFEHSKVNDHILSFQLPTWEVNPDVPYEQDELEGARARNLERFKIEYGGQWGEGGTMGDFFETELVERCVRGDIEEQLKPNYKCNYFLHVDPATGGDNYSAVLVAKERYITKQGQKRNKCYLAKCKVWRPITGIGLIFKDIDREILSWCQMFRPSLVTYDDYHSIQSLQFLRSHGVNCMKVQYNRNHKMKIYQNLKDMMMYSPDPEVSLYDDGGDSSLLLAELKSLKRKRTQRGFSIQPDKHGAITTDDLADCLAGACSSANDGIRMPLPRGVVVHTGIR